MGILIKVRRYRKDTAIAVGRLLPKDFDLVLIEKAPITALKKTYTKQLSESETVILVVRRVQQNAIPKEIF